LELGYDPEQFEAVDRQMNSGPRMGVDKHKVDRYGKKYGWIAYFEMWGERSFHYRSAEAHNLHEYVTNHEHIHKRAHVYRPASGAQS
tara:strand:+ start:348 stop:608 length:261 start_codon:yes stop_codon:yes gene_type:complete